eukprot:13822698-Ditylum_brightwellii.AAC.1
MTGGAAAKDNGNDDKTDTSTPALVRQNNDSDDEESEKGDKKESSNDLPNDLGERESPISLMDPGESLPQDNGNNDKIDMSMPDLVR